MTASEIATRVPLRPIWVDAGRGSEFDLLITDASLDEAAVAKVRAAGLDVVIA